MDRKKKKKKVHYLSLRGEKTKTLDLCAHEKLRGKQST